MFRLIPAVVFVLAVAPGIVRGDEPLPLTPKEVFELRIMPIFKSSQPASCVQCHLAGVDLKNYILPSHEQTFVSLRDQGMVDMAEPKKSKILSLIAMGDKDVDKGARLIHEETRKAEYEAFEAWLTACCNDPKLRELPRLDMTTLAKPPRPDEVIRHARKSRVVDSFERNVWSQRMRCFPCHTPYEIDLTNPQHKQALEKHKDFLGNYADRMILFRETPAATVQYLIEKSRQALEAEELPLVNLEDPAKSLLVLKPTSKLPPRKGNGEFEQPSYVTPVSHMGGLKMHIDDQSYKAFMAWLQDYANVVGDKYSSVTELPADNWLPSKYAVILRDVPEAWPERARVQFFVHGWNAKEAAWEKNPAAFTQSQLNPRRNAAGLLFLLGPVRATGENEPRPMRPEQFTLAQGKYLVKVYLDRNGRLNDDPTIFLGEAEYAGQVEIDAKWEEGFLQAEKLSGTLMK